MMLAACASQTRSLRACGSNISPSSPTGRPCHDHAQARQKTVAHVLRRRHEDARRRAGGNRGRLPSPRRSGRSRVAATTRNRHDSKDDIAAVAIDGLDHLIPKPREIYVEDGAQGFLALEIVDADDVRQIIKLRDPLALPAPARASGSRRT